jgi:hypothetical protein
VCTFQTLFSFFFFNHLFLTGRVVTKYRAIFIFNSLQHPGALQAWHVLQTILRSSRQTLSVSLQM